MNQAILFPSLMDWAWDSYLTSSLWRPQHNPGRSTQSQESLVDPHGYGVADHQHRRELRIRTCPQRWLLPQYKRWKEVDPIRNPTERHTLSTSLLMSYRWIGHIEFFHWGMTLSIEVADRKFPKRFPVAVGESCDPPCRKPSSGH